MPNPLINIGSAANDGTGELGPRSWLQKINRLPNADSMINAGSGDYTGTTEQKITAAVAAAVVAGAKCVFLPQSMLPYNESLVTLNSAVRLIAENDDPTGFAARAYGANGDGVTDDTVSLAAAITAANTWPPGQGAVTLRAGDSYVISSQLTLPGGSRLEGPQSTIISKLPSGNALHLTGNYGTVVLKNLQHNVATGGTANGLVFFGAEFWQVAIEAVWNFPGINVLFAAIGTVQDTHNNALFVQHVTNNLGTGSNILFQSKSVGGDFRVEGNTVFGGLSIAGNAYELKFGDNTAQDTAQYNAFFGDAHATANHAPIQIANSVNGFDGSCFRDVGTTFVTTSGTPSPSILHIRNLITKQNLAPHTVIGGIGPQQGTWLVDTEGGDQLVRDTALADHWWMAFRAGGNVELFGGGNNPAGSQLLINGMVRSTTRLVGARTTPSEAVLVSGVDASAGNIIEVTLTAARLVGAPLNTQDGQRLTFILIQDGTGGRAVTWNAVFKVSWSDAGNTANKRSSISFIWDGAAWNQDGAQAPYT